LANREARGKEEPMPATRGLVILSVNILLLTAVRRTHAQDLPPFSPAPPLVPVTSRLDGPPFWQRLVLGLSVGAAAVGLVVGVGAKVAESQKIREFNDYRLQRDPGSTPGLDMCTVGVPNAGPPGCAEMLAEARRAGRWSAAGFVTTGTFALTAIVVAVLTGEDDPPRYASGGPPLTLLRF
jgi:hypothetical protein